MSKVTKGALAAATGILVLGGAGTIAFGIFESLPGVVRVGQQEWSVLIVALGLVGYAGAILVAAFGKRRPRHLRN